MMDVFEETLWDARAFVYRLLSVALALPDQRVADALADGSLVGDVEAAAQMVGLASGSPASTAFERAMSDFEASARSVVLGDLRREYTRLFSSPSAVLPAWETAFVRRTQPRGADDLLLVRSREAVDARHRYEEAGARVVGGESPDHMRVECAFAAYLCEKAVLSADGDQRSCWVGRYERFAATHLDRWMREFFSCVSCEARIPYYHVVGLIGARTELGIVRA